MHAGFFGGKQIFALMLLVGGFVIVPPATTAQSRVELTRQGDAFQLTRNGEPYFIKGVGGDAYLNALVEAGGNSIRTWSTDNIDEILVRAQKHGLTVCVGMWLGHERHGFNYQDEAAVRKQREECLATVQKYKDHPAVLLWGIGNEMEGEGTNVEVWNAVEEIAREVKRIDPHHPTMTVIAEVGEGGSKVRAVEQHCPSIDIVGVNSYGGITTVAERYQQAGATKPYIVTEFGPLGPWEVGKTEWGSAIEQSSTEKADFYALGYRQAVQQPKNLCLGSYVFLWGHKQETTATWFGMLLSSGERLEPVDVMTQVWTGEPPPNRCPRIERLVVNRSEDLKPGDRVAAKLIASDPEGDELSVKWILRRDSVTIGEGGDPQSAEKEWTELIKANGDAATVTLPPESGGYRLFGYVFDGQGGAAVANVPLWVE